MAAQIIIPGRQGIDQLIAPTYLETTPQAITIDLTQYAEYALYRLFLQLKGSASISHNLFLNFNDDLSSGNYNVQNLSSPAGTWAANTTFNALYGMIIGEITPNEANDANTYSVFQLDLWGLKRTDRFKQISGYGARLATAAGEKPFYDLKAQWRSTAAVTEINLTCESGVTLVESSLYTMHGIGKV